MPTEFTHVTGGGVSTPKGFLAGATAAGVKTYAQEKLDLGMLFSQEPASAAGVFTTNRVRSPSVVLSERHVASGRARAIVANSGCANCCVGEQGLKDAREVVGLAAQQLGVQPEEVLICSTGIIGVELPMALLRAGLRRVQTSREGGHDFARAIMTTDSHVKEIAVSFPLQGKTVSLGGCAKGAGMIHPQMATMLAFLTTDATAEAPFLRSALKEAVDASFNMISVDGDTSTNDTVLLLANGAAGAPPLREGSPEAQFFQEALLYVCGHLAREIVRNGEGATKLIEIVVEGAKTLADARAAARAVASSSLVKVAVHGNDPNWGRVMMAIGKSGAEVEEPRVSLYINEVCIVETGRPIPFYKEAVVASMQRAEVSFRVNLNLGSASARAWGCDLSEEYVSFNTAYPT